MFTNNDTTALVAGGAGFIGSNLCHQLIKEGKQVICVDNLMTGRIDNISDLMDNSHFHFVHHDITYPLKDNLNP